MDKTLLKGLMVLETMSELRDESYTIDQIAELVGLTRSNTHRTLQTLMHANYLKRDADTGRYRCTLKMFELGAKQVARLDARKYAPPFMRELAYATNETVHLSVLDAWKVVYIDKVDSPQPLVAYSTLGGRAPAHLVATGKVLLAFQQADYLPLYLEEVGHSGDEDSAIEVRALQEDLNVVREIGYAINRGQWRPGVGGVAAPIFDGLHNIQAALGISAPLERLSDEMLARSIPIVQSAAKQISMRIGYRGDYFGIPLT